MKIRAFNDSDQDYEGILDVHNALWPRHPNTVGQWKHWDGNRDPERIFRRFVAELNGDGIVAYASYGEDAWSHQPGKMKLGVNVHPRWQRQGIGSTLYDFLLQQMNGQPLRKLMAETREDCADGVRFLERRGFAPAMRYPISELDSATFDPSPFAERLRRTQEAGIVIKALAELRQVDPEWKQKCYDLEWELLRDVPSPDELTPTGFEYYEKNIINNPAFMPEAYFVALDGDKWVGMSNLWRNLATRRRLETGLTGVVRSHRRKGVATALKVRAIQFAQVYGNAVVETGNEEHNPMLQLNLQLGFKPTPAWVDFVKELDSAETRMPV